MKAVARSLTSDLSFGWKCEYPFGREIYAIYLLKGPDPVCGAIAGQGFIAPASG
ncbi:hypothetical protein [Roseobacter sp. SK209-2-6]|uniref:hypothetical protein n=1 Tax=Roseobacter sp. SK209-2-6 TaxID=388739 RepID=UPI000317DB73|nr:hypothetical protein [Roseobacter sp. SK209-2-6]